MTLSEIRERAIAPALALLPARMSSREAEINLLTIGLQESRFVHRRQMGNGPARSFWQGELGGGMVAGVRTHEATKADAAALYRARSIAPNRSIWTAIEHDDVLAAGLARLLLWSDPGQLPAAEDVDGAWRLYLKTWRPGAYDRGTAEQRAELRAKWGRNFAAAVREVMTAWLKFVPGWAWWVLALAVVAGGQQMRVLSAQSLAAKVQTELARQAEDHQAYLRQVAEANAAVILKQQADRLALEKRLAKTDQQSTEKLTHALSKNDRLERLYSSADDERRRLRIEVAP